MTREGDPLSSSISPTDVAPDRLAVPGDQKKVVFDPQGSGHDIPTASETVAQKTPRTREEILFERVAELEEQVQAAQAGLERYRRMEREKKRRYRERYPERVREYNREYKREWRARQHKQQGPNAK